MKNSLQLQLNQKIKSANKLLKDRKFQQAVQQYTHCLQLYEENRTYNDSISTDIKVVILSLRGVGNTYALKHDQAQQDFDKSYNLSPYNASILNRRARFYLNRRRYPEAIEDVSKAIIYQPDNVKHQVLISEIKEAVEKITEQKERNRLKKLIENMNKFDLQQEQDQEQLIKFSNLRKIDRVSIRRTQKKRGTILSFKEDDVIEYQTQQQSGQTQNKKVMDIESILKQQDQQLKNIMGNEIEEKINIYNTPKIVNKNKGKSRKSVLRGSLASGSGSESIMSVKNDHNNQTEKRSSISAISIKNIDGKLIKHDKKEQAIRFRSMVSSTFSQFSSLKSPSNEQMTVDSSCIIDADEGQVVKIKVLKINQNNQIPPSIQKKPMNKGPRKSCLRTSHFSGQSSEEQSKKSENNVLNINPCSNTTRSSFFRLKNIDKPIQRKGNSQQRQSKNNIKQNLNVQQSDSSDDDSNEHNVFYERNQDQILKALENMNNISGGGSFQGAGKKSILKKASVVNPNIEHKPSNFRNPSSWNKSNKKSVCFKTN